MHSPLLRIANPQSINRLGHFLTPDYKSGGTPGGLAVLKKELLCGTPSGLAVLKKELLCGTPGGLAVLKNETPSKHIIKFKAQSLKFNIQSSK